MCQLRQESCSSFCSSDSEDSTRDIPVTSCSGLGSPVTGGMAVVEPDTVLCCPVLDSIRQMFLSVMGDGQRIAHL